MRQVSYVANISLYTKTWKWANLLRKSSLLLSLYLWLFFADDFQHHHFFCQANYFSPVLALSSIVSPPPPLDSYIWCVCCRVLGRHTSRGSHKPGPVGYMKPQVDHSNTNNVLIIFTLFLHFFFFCKPLMAIKFMYQTDVSA